MCLGTGHIEKVFHQYGILYASLNHNYVKITLGTDYMEIISHQYVFFHAPSSFHLLKKMLDTDYMEKAFQCGILYFS